MRSIVECYSSCNQDRMTALNGRWKLVSTSNLENYHNTIQTTEEYKDKLRELGAARKTNPDIYWEEFHIDPAAGTLRRSIYIDNEKKREVNYKFGIVNDGVSADGRAMKVSLGLVGDNKVTIHEKGPGGLEINGLIEVKGNELTFGLSSQGVSSAMNFTKIA